MSVRRLKKSRQWKNHGLISSVMISLLLLGCNSSSENQSETAAPPPFVFRKLELEQKKPGGNVDWILSSPEARYELTRRMVRAKNPIGKLYNNNNPSFEIKADFAVVINDGEQIILEGDVQLQQLNGQKILIKGHRLIWRPEFSQLVMDQKPMAFDEQSRITANIATLQQDTNNLTLNGPVELDRWQKEVDLEIKPDTALQTGKAIWNLDDGSLQAEGPITGQHRDPEGVVLEQLEGRNLTGNTKDGLITVKSPVTVKIPKNKGLLRADDTTWNFQKQTLNSQKPFQGLINQTEIIGDSFFAELDQTTVLIRERCIIEQPGEQLRARQCRWNWKTNAVLATGDVRLERDANNQITEAQTLSGNVGEKGSLVFSAPDNKVRSEVTIKKGIGDVNPTERSKPQLEF